jgi:ribose transport system permease protein
VTVQPIAANGHGHIADWLVRYSALLALIAVLAVFSVSIPTFPTPQNLASVLVNNFALLAIVSIGMTLVVAVGGIDLSVGTAVDFSSLAFVFLVLSGHAVWLSALAGLASGLAVGLFNAFLIGRLGITPFLATLGTLFIGHSGQQLLTGGGNPVYLPSSVVPPSFAFLGHGAVFGVPVVLVAVAALGVAVEILLKRSRLGRIILATGVHRSVAWHSGLPTSSVSGFAYALSALVCAVAGLILSATVNVYVPYSGNAFLLNAIGATFIGTTLDANGRPNVPGTLIGVLLLAVVANGLLLSGLNFYWQQVGTGVLIFLVLAASFGKGARASE